MLKYNLLCTHDHTFEGWFVRKRVFETKKKEDDLLVPMCDDTGIRRALMVPNISKKTSSKKDNTAFLMADRL